MGDRQPIPMLCYFMVLSFQHMVQQLFAPCVEMQVVCNNAQLNTDTRQSKLAIKVVVQFVIRFALSELSGKFDVACSMVLSLDATTTMLPHACC